MKQTHTLVQGTPEWSLHRSKFFNASDASAMLGLSKYKSRTELLREIKTGIIPEYNSATMARFAKGHEYEAIARPWAEEIIETELYPVVMSNEIDGIPLSASFDGIDMLEEVTFEHKTGSASLIASLEAGVIPDEYKPQLEQGLLISGASRCLFMASSGDKTLMRFAWYESDKKIRAQLIAGWKQFATDLENYMQAESTPTIVAEAVQSLPTVSVQISGQITVRENFKVFEVALRDFLENRLIREPQTDQDFADLDLQIKAMKKAEEALNAAEAQMLAQVNSLDEAKRQKDMLAKLVRDNRLMAEKLLDSEKTRRKSEKVEATRKAFAAHVTELQREISRVRIDVVAPDFANAIKGLKTLDSMQDKLDTALANGKIMADSIAADIRTKISWLDANAAEHYALLADLQQLIAKPLDDFKLAVMARVEAHKKAEAERIEAERARIRAEEEARAKAAADRERAKIEAETRAKVEQEQREEEARAKAEQQAEIKSAQQIAPSQNELTVNPSTSKRQRPSDNEIVIVLANHYKVSNSEVVEWLEKFIFN